MLHDLIYLAVGAVAGTLAGLLGIGGGIIVVPSLTLLLPWMGVPQEWVVHIAVATSLAIIIVTSSSSTWAHHKRGAVQWKYVKLAAPVLAVGVVIGALSATYIPGQILARIIGVILFVIALRMFFKKLPKGIVTPENRKKEPVWRFGLLNMLFGCLSGMLGVGGGTFLVPYITGKLHKTMQQAAATGSACAIILGAVSSITYIAAGWGLPNMPADTLGYVYWPAFFGIGIASALCAPFGAKLAHKLPAQQLRYLFACLLVVVAIKMAI